MRVLDADSSMRRSEAQQCRLDLFGILHSLRMKRGTAQSKGLRCLRHWQEGCRVIPNGMLPVNGPLVGFANVNVIRISRLTIRASCAMPMRLRA
jgi:hypothetical protein